LSSKDIVGIKPGDLLLFAHVIDLPVTLSLGQHPVFQAFVMRRGRRRVARLVGPHPKTQTREKKPS
jgi:flagellar motor switch protein FliM